METKRREGGRAPTRRAMRENVTPTPDERRSRAGDEDTAASTGVRAVGPASRYVLGALLGRGGMADVYRAKDRTLGRDVAVKLMRERTPDTSERARFIAEAQMLARLNHPNLVTILDAGISDEQPFLVLELVGSSLSAALKQGGRGLPADRVRHIGAQIAAALAHCHAAGIVHRDVKPGNILLGTGGRALLTDFGISRLLDGTHSTRRPVSPSAPPATWPPSRSTATTSLQQSTSMPSAWSCSRPAQGDASTRAPRSRRPSRGSIGARAFLRTYLQPSPVSSRP